MILQTPTAAHLSRMYFELAKIGAMSAGERKPWPHKINNREELIALACDMSRFDPRLVDILVEYFINHWRELNPAKLRSCYSKMKTPQTVAVTAEFLAGESNEEEAQFFVRYLCMGLKPVSHQFYFYNLYSPGGTLAARAVEEGISEYRKWGFFARERPVVDLAGKKSAGSFDSVSRRNILKRLIGEKKEIGLKDYLEALEHSVSRQQALSDIKKSGLVKRVGSGRGAKWKGVAA